FIEASGIRPANIVAVVCLEQLGGPDSDLLVLDGAQSTLGLEVLALDPSARSIVAEDHRYGHAPFLDLRVPAVTLARPALPGPDGTIPPLSMAALRRDAELTFRLLWDLADRNELPRLVDLTEPPPVVTAPSRPPPLPPPAEAPEARAGTAADAGGPPDAEADANADEAAEPDPSDQP